MRQGALADLDLLVLTFSKSFAGVGGALVARKEITRYVNGYARCRMFSCAMDPAVTGGILKALQLAASADGDARRARLHRNTALMRGLLEGKVRLGTSQSWIVPVVFRIGAPLHRGQRRPPAPRAGCRRPHVPRRGPRAGPRSPVHHVRAHRGSSTVTVLISPGATHLDPRYLADPMRRLTDTAIHVL